MGPRDEPEDEFRIGPLTNRMKKIIIIGAGPAGLMAADVVSAGGHAVTVVDRMPSIGRKFLIAGRGGLNLTHSEPIEPFLRRYGDARDWLERHIRGFPPTDLIAFAHALGQETFVGSSGRVFPKRMKASPMLRAWLARLAGRGVKFRARQRWVGFDAQGQPEFQGEAGERVVMQADAVILALGGASWPRLGSDGSWVPILQKLGIEIASIEPTNCGVRIAWSEFLATRFAGEPLKRIAITVGAKSGRGEALITATGLEGGAIYALTADVRRALADTTRPATLTIDLRPDLSVDELVKPLSRARDKISTAAFLHRTVGLPPVARALLHESAGRTLPVAPRELAHLIKHVTLPLAGLAGIERAISSAGGIMAIAFDEQLMLHRRPGCFVAGEMLDWEAPTGGYLLQACIATGRAAGKGALAWLDRQS